MAHPARRVRLRHIVLVLAILAGITPLVALHLGQPAIGASAVVPGVGLADIAIGQPISEVLNRFGTPSAVRLTGTAGLLGYGFDQYGITVYAHGDVVQAIATTNSVISGANGLTLGTPMAAVVKALGDKYTPATIEGFPGIVYRDAGIAFGLDRDAVASILVFRAAAAAPAQAPTTGQTGPFVDPAANTTAMAGTPDVFDVSQLRAFTSASRFLSLHGYLRLMMHASANTWMSVQEADRLIRERDYTELR
jgi:hypothetical protein